MDTNQAIRLRHKYAEKMSTELMPGTEFKLHTHSAAMTAAGCHQFKGGGSGLHRRMKLVWEKRMKRVKERMLG